MSHILSQPRTRTTLANKRRFSYGCMCRLALKIVVAVLVFILLAVFGLYMQDRRNMRARLKVLTRLVYNGTYAGLNTSAAGSESFHECLATDPCEAVVLATACICKGEVIIVNTAPINSGRRALTDGVCEISAHCFTATVSLFPLPLGPSFNMDSSVYGVKNTLIHGYCSGAKADVAGGQRCTIGSSLIGPTSGSSGLRVIWKEKTGCWLCTKRYRLQVRTPKYVQFGLTGITFRVMYDRSFTNLGHSDAWYSICYDELVYGKKVNVVCTGSSASLLLATPAVTLWMS